MTDEKIALVEGRKAGAQKLPRKSVMTEDPAGEINDDVVLTILNRRCAPACGR